MSWWLKVLLIFAAFCTMEFVAWAAHKYVMHGFLWSLHKDHHIKRPGFFEKNDAFFLIFAIPCWLCIMLGMMYQSEASIYVGIGILIYGLAYFLVHEVFIHQRFKWFKNSQNAYFKAILMAHKMHHKHLEREGSESFGMLIVHPKYFKAAFSKTQTSKTVSR